MSDVGIDFDKFRPSDLPEDLRVELTKRLQGTERLNITSHHPGTNGSPVAFDFEEASGGNQVMFDIAGAWLDVLENGRVLIIDELHNSLHPLALRHLVKLFHDPRINSRYTQMISSSHETSVMAKGFMTQDQVWLVERDDIGNSMLFPLSDYAVSDMSTFQNACFDGRFGAVPSLTDCLDG